jgi:hypothetical protein
VYRVYQYVSHSHFVSMPTTIGVSSYDIGVEVKAKCPPTTSQYFSLGSGLEGKLKWSLTDISALKSCAVGTLSSPCAAL